MLSRQRERRERRRRRDRDNRPGYGAPLRPSRTQARLPLSPPLDLSQELAQISTRVREAVVHVPGDEADLDRLSFESSRSGEGAEGLGRFDDRGAASGVGRSAGEGGGGGGRGFGELVPQGAQALKELLWTFWRVLERDGGRGTGRR